MWLTILVFLIALYQFFLAAYVYKDDQKDWKMFSFTMGAMAMVLLAFNPVL